jgi:prolyl oligopeptidase
MKMAKPSGSYFTLVCLFLWLVCFAALSAQTKPAGPPIGHASTPTTGMPGGPDDHSRALTAGAPQAPVARQDNVKEMIHGVEIVDPYRWLEDQDSAETKSWVAAENAYTHSVLDGLPVRERAYRQLMDLENHDSFTVPDLQNGVYFFFKRAAGEDLRSVYMRKGISGKDELLLDPLPLSADHTTSIGGVLPAHDASLLLYNIRRGGEDETEIHVLDVNTHRDLPDALPRAFYVSFSWKSDKTGFFYGRADREKGKRIYYHALGTDPASDPELFGKGYGPDYWVSAEASRNGRYLLAIVSKGWASTEVFIKNLETNSDFQPLITGLNSHVEVGFAGDSLYVMTDWKAPKYRILKIDLHDPAQDKWKEIVPSTDDAIQSFSLIGGKLYVTYLQNVTSRILVFSPEGKALGQVELPSVGSGGTYGHWEQDEGILSFSSYTTPNSVYRYFASTGERDLWYRDPAPFETDRYQMEQVWYSSKDGTRVPMFLIHRKGLKPNGQTPTILYGYGGFNVSITPHFDTTAAWWVEHGGLYAVANLRGGSEFGEAWHKAGMLANKQNVFDDFIAAAEWLIKNKYTNPQKLAIYGGSNGGLLVGAVMTQRPELFRAVLCWHPDLDMVRYYKFTRNNNPPALLEYGNAADPEQFKFLYAYSPYQHVKQGTKYPAVLFISGDADTRVPPEQARKMAARMQAATGSGLPVMLLYDTKAGHSGGKPFTKIVEDQSLELTFLAWQLGLK